MKIKDLSGIILAFTLVGCGGANDHPEELKGTWVENCRSTVSSYTFDEGLTLNATSYTDSGCNQRRANLAFELSAMYDPELKTTSSGVQALKADLTLLNIFVTPFDDWALQSYVNTCPSLSWSKGNPTNIKNCNNSSIQGLYAQFEPNLPTLLYVNNNILYTSKSGTAIGEDGYPLDVDYSKGYIKQ